MCPPVCPALTAWGNLGTHRMGYSGYSAQVFNVYEVECAFLQIYNEQVRVPAAANASIRC